MASQKSGVTSWSAAESESSPRPLEQQGPTLLSPTLAWILSPYSGIQDPIVFKFALLSFQLFGFWIRVRNIVLCV